MIGMGSVGNDGTSLAALLEVVSDPEAAKAKLNEFNAKIEESKGFLEQAKGVNAENERLVREIREKTEGAFRAQAAKEEELARRESQLAARHNEVTSGHQELLTLKEELRALEQSVAQRVLAVAHAEQELQAKVTKTLNDAAQVITDRKSTLEQEYAALKAKAEKALGEANQHAAEAAAANAAAQELKASTEKRAAALKKAMEG